MQHPFGQLAPEYLALWNALDIRPEVSALLDRTVRVVVLPLMPIYQEIEQATRVPCPVIAAIHYRESTCNVRRHLHNGDPLTARTVHVPKGRIPGLDPPYTFAQSAIDALRLDRLDQVTNWSLARAAYMLELYNGFGYRARGLHSPYLWAGSSAYVRGKFASDGHFDADLVDRQFGAMVLIRALMDVHGSLWLPETEPSTSLVRDGSANGLPRVTFLGLQAGDVHAIQICLNKLGADPQLVVDGSYGRNTRRAVEAFQQSHGLAVDGLVGPQTARALETALTNSPATSPA